MGAQDGWGSSLDQAGRGLEHVRAIFVRSNHARMGLGSVAADADAEGCALASCLDVPWSRHRDDEGPLPLAIRRFGGRELDTRRRPKAPLSSGRPVGPSLVPPRAGSSTTDARFGYAAVAWGKAIASTKCS